MGYGGYLKELLEPLGSLTFERAYDLFREMMAAGAAAGAFLAVSLQAGLLRKIFGGFLLLMGLSEIFKKKKGEGTHGKG